MKRTLLLAGLSAALLCIGSPCAAATPTPVAPAKPSAAKPAPAGSTRPGWLERLLAKPAVPGLPAPWLTPLPEPLELLDPSVCPVPLERGYCPVG